MDLMFKRSSTASIFVGPILHPKLNVGASGNIYKSNFMIYGSNEVAACVNIIIVLNAVIAEIVSEYLFLWIKFLKMDV